MRALAVFWSWVFLSTLIGGPAGAQTTLSPGASSTSARDEARAHFTIGESRFKAGDYRGAISEFRAADRLVPSPILTYNVALCYEKLGDNGQAVALYKQYLDRRPDAPNRAQVEQRLGALAAAAPQVAPVPVAP